MFAKENLFLIDLNGTLVFLTTDPRNGGYVGKVTERVVLDDRTNEENQHRWLLDHQPGCILGRSFQDERQYCLFGFPEQIRQSLYEEVDQPFIQAQTLAEAREELGLPPPRDPSPAASSSPAAPEQHKRQWGCGVIVLLLVTGCLLSGLLAIAAI